MARFPVAAEYAKTKRGPFGPLFFCFFAAGKPLLQSRSYRNRGKMPFLLVVRQVVVFTEAGRLISSATGRWSESVQFNTRALSTCRSSEMKM